MSTTYRVAIGVDDSGAITQIDQLEAKAEKSDKYVNNSVAVANTLIGGAEARALSSKVNIDAEIKDMDAEIAKADNEISEFFARSGALDVDVVKRKIELEKLKAEATSFDFILQQEKTTLENIIRIFNEEAKSVPMSILNRFHEVEAEIAAGTVSTNAKIDDTKTKATLAVVDVNNKIEMTRRNLLMVGHMGLSIFNMVADAMGVSLGVAGNVISSVISMVSAVSMMASTETPNPMTMVHGFYMIGMAAASMAKAMEAERKRQQAEGELEASRNKIKVTSIMVMM